MIAESYPEIAIPLRIYWPEMISLLLASIAVVALGPAFITRKLGRMYIPSALQVLE